MELRTAEQELNEMLTSYESLRQSEHWGGNSSSSNDADAVLPVLELPEAHPARAVLESLEVRRFSDEAQVLEALETLRDKFPVLEPKIKKFRQRLAEKDPITEAPRYGAKTAERVTHLLALHGALKRAVWNVFGLELDPEDEKADSSAATAPSEENNSNNNPQEDPDSAVAKLREKIAEQEQAARNQELERQRQQQEEEARQKAEEERLQQEEAARRQAEEGRRRAEEAEIARRAEAVRQSQRQAEEAAAQAERDWVNSIPKGPEGVRKQISVLKEATANDPVAQTTALSSLLQIFTQIAKHPEEINFRRIRRDHPKFNQDIGRHPGGKEILLAAGFTLTTLDDIPCFFSKEPDLESDMDGWSAWFDNLKATLEVVKEMQ